MRQKLNYLDHTDMMVLANGLRTAFSVFKDDENEMREAAERYEALDDVQRAAHDSGMVHGSVYRRLEAQFHQQAGATLELLKKIEDEELAIVVED